MQTTLLSTMRIRTFALLMFLMIGNQLLAQIPTITSFSPGIAKPGDTVTLVGSNFNTTAADNVVYFGATRATLVSASSTQVKALVPTGATRAYIRLINLATQKQGQSGVQFQPAFTPTIQSITASSYSSVASFAQSGAYKTCIGDLDLDGKSDILVSNSSYVTINVNQSTPGSLTTSSFSSGTNLNFGNTANRSNDLADLNNDGKLDIVSAGGNVELSYFLNQSTPGNLSFGSKVNLTGTSNNYFNVSAHDIDGDGLVDLVATNLINSFIYIFINTTRNGVISFAPSITISTLAFPSEVRFSDLDKDGKPDLIVACRTANTLCVYKNNSSPGAFSLASLGTRQDFTTASAPWIPSTVDLDGDGLEEVLVACSTTGVVSVFKNTSTAGVISLSPKQDFSFSGNIYRGLAMSDMDGDKDLDIVLCNGNQIGIAPNTSSGGTISFGSAAVISAGNNNLFVSIADFDGDTSPDVVCCFNISSQIGVFRTLTPTPTISTTSSFTSFSSCELTPSANQTFTVSGSGLQSNITLTAPANFEVSLSASSGFSSSIIIPTSTGLIPSTTVYVRMNASVPGTFNGNLTLSSSNATSAVVSVSGVATPRTVTKTITSACGSYTWSVNGQSYTSSGTYVNTVGCNTDSLVLTINPITSSRATVKACGSYTWPSNGQTYTSSGTYVNTVGCNTDSLVLTINPITSSRATVKACGSYTWASNGQTYTNSGTYVNTVGCTTDSIILTIVKVSFLQPLSPSSICINGGSVSATVSNEATTINWYINGALSTTTSTSLADNSLVAGGNGQGSQANQFVFPMGVATDTFGNVYVADYTNHRVQKWVSGATSGVTVAGGNGIGGASNQLNYPTSVFVTPNGDLYVADNGNSRVQKWAVGATSGVTVAGGNGIGTASNQLTGALSVFVDNAGAVYVGSPQRVTKWLPGATTGILVAGGNGNGSAANQISLPYGLYVDAAGTIYFSDFSNHRVQKWTAGATTGTTVAGGNGAGSAANQLNYPTGVYVNSKGELFVTDKENYRVQRFSTATSNLNDGITVAGTGTAGYTLRELATPWGLCIDKSDNVIVTEGDANRVVKLSLKRTSSITTFKPQKLVAVATNGATCTANSDTVKPFASESKTIAICEGDSVIMNGVVLKTPGNYIQTIARPGQCDSVLTITLNRSRVPLASVTPSLSNSCDTTFATFNTVVSNSTVLKITAPYLFSMNAMIPTGSPAVATNTIQFTQLLRPVGRGNVGCRVGAVAAGSVLIIYSGGACTDLAKVNFAASSGASAVILINSVSSPTFPASLNLSGATLPTIMISKADGDYLISLMSNGATIAGNTQTCVDSVSYSWMGTQLNTLSNVSTVLPITVNGTQISVKIKDVSGCMSSTSTTASIPVKYSSTSTTSFTACGSYTWNGSTYTSSGTYVYNTVNSSGCDSSATLHLTIIPYTVRVTTVNLMATSYTWSANNVVYTTSGNYASISGCFLDSLYLTLVPPTVSNQYLHAWVKTAGLLQQTTGIANVADASNNVYVTGTFGPQANFSSTDSLKVRSTLNLLDRDVYVAKYNATGGLVWAQRFGGTGKEDVYDIDIDASGNVYLIGQYTGSMTVGNTTLTSVGRRDIFVVKLNSVGNPLFAFSLGSTSSYNFPKSIAVANNRIVISGSFIGPLTIGSITGNSGNSNTDMFLATFDAANGSNQWVKFIHGDGADFSSAVAIDGSDNIVMTGYFCNNGVGGIGPWGLNSTGIYDAFVVKYDRNGNQIWVNSLRGRGSEFATGVSTSSNGDVYLSGYFDDNIISESTVRATSGNLDWFVAKYSSAGTFQFLKSAGGAGADMANGISTSASGNSSLTGVYQGSANMFGSSRSGNAGGSALVTTLDANGSIVWNAGPSNGAVTVGNSIAAGANNVFFYTGNLTGSSTFGTFGATSAGNRSMFTARLTPATGFTGEPVSKAAPVSPAAGVFEPMIPASIEWLAFNANTTSRGMDLNWKVSYEFANTRYFVEQSVNGVDWEVIATTNSNSVTLNNSQFAEGAIIRVRQQSGSGVYSYSEMVKTNISSKSINVSVYPNPTAGDLTVETGLTENTLLTIYNMNGQAVKVIKLSNQPKAIIETADLSQGMYMLKVQSSSNTETVRFSVVK